MDRNGRRLRVEPTDEWEQIEFLCGWLKAMRMRGYTPRAPHRPRALQQVLFPYADAM
jgi:hypothetical protein